MEFPIIIHGISLDGQIRRTKKDVKAWEKILKEAETRGLVQKRANRLQIGDTFLLNEFYAHPIEPSARRVSRYIPTTTFLTVEGINSKPRPYSHCFEVRNKRKTRYAVVVNKTQYLWVKKKKPCKKKR